jgi:DNA helicase-2/ATP-dependent DNA helicase PcrA
MQDELSAAGVQWNVVGKMPFHHRSEVKDVLSYLSWVVNPDDGVALERIYSKPPRGLGARYQLQ